MSGPVTFHAHPSNSAYEGYLCQLLNSWSLSDLEPRVNSEVEFISTPRTGLDMGLSHVPSFGIESDINTILSNDRRDGVLFAVPINAPVGPRFSFDHSWELPEAEEPEASPSGPKPKGASKVRFQAVHHEQLFDKKAPPSVVQRYAPSQDSMSVTRVRAPGAPAVRGRVPSRARASTPASHRHCHHGHSHGGC